MQERKKSPTLFNPRSRAKAKPDLAQDHQESATTKVKETRAPFKLFNRPTTEASTKDSSKSRRYRDQLERPKKPAPEPPPRTKKINEKLYQRLSKVTTSTTVPTPQTKVSVTVGNISETTSKITIKPKSKEDGSPEDKSSGGSRFESPLARLLKHKKERDEAIKHKKGDATPPALVETTPSTSSAESTPKSDEVATTEPAIFVVTPVSVQEEAPPRSEEASNEIEKRPRTATYRRHSELPAGRDPHRPTGDEQVVITPKPGNAGSGVTDAPRPVQAVSVESAAGAGSGVTGSSNGETGGSNIFNPARSAVYASGNSTLLEQIRSTVAPLFETLPTKSPVSYRTPNSVVRNICCKGVTAP